MSQSPRDSNCVFCKIAAGEIPSTRVFETDEAIAFLDINPVNKGHILIIPRAHYARVLDLPDDLSAHIGSLLPRLARAVHEATGAEDSNVVINSGPVAGQTVFHCHWHIVPRFQGDPVRWPWPQGSYAGDEASQMSDAIIKALKGE